MLEKFYNLTTIDKIEKMFGFKLLSYLPNNYKFDNVYNLDNGRYALLTDLDHFMNSNIQIDTYLKEFVNNVKQSILDIDGIEYDINISLSYAFGKYMLYEDAKAGLDEVIDKNMIICHSNDFSIRHQKEAKKNLDVIKMVKIALDNYNIISYFQPIINNKTQVIEKYESLVRLVDEEGKVLTPYEFLNISKKGIYYNKITDRVLENSFKMLKAITTKLSINLSTIDIEKEATRDKIYQLLEEYKDDKKRLIFELLEDENIKDFDNIISFIKTVKAQGVSIAIDDFGAGYSNFERLLKFEPDILKIDGSIIKNIVHDEYSRNVVETIVTFAKKQNIQTVAEFVETKEIFDYLKELGVDYSQGYYFGKPEELKLH
jgi:EAL domain-containing protein (putative c-di-GMP-specific phosphodiesterase class I)